MFVFLPRPEHGPALQALCPRLVKQVLFPLQQAPHLLQLVKRALVGLGQVLAQRLVMFALLARIQIR